MPGFIKKTVHSSTKKYHSKVSIMIYNAIEELENLTTNSDTTVALFSDSIEISGNDDRILFA